MLQLSADLLEQPDWSSRLKLAVDYMLSSGHFSTTEDVSQAAESFYKKLVIADKYKPSEKLQSAVRLVKVTSGHLEAKELGDDFGLHQVGYSVCTRALSPTLLVKITVHFVAQ